MADVANLEPKRRRLGTGESPSDGAVRRSVAVLGCGAMGSVYAGFFASAGNDVWAVDVWKDHVEAMQQKGLRVEGPKGDFTVPLKATMNSEDVPPCDIIIIATKASGVADAAKTASKIVKSDGVVITIQNGLGAGERIAEHIDTKQVMLGIASNFGACMKGPGHAEHKSMNMIIIGEINGGLSTRLTEVVGAWTDAGFNATPCEDINGKIWDKLICNVFVGSCALTGMTVGEMLDNVASKQVALACAREAYAVAIAKGIKLSFDDVQAHVEKFTSTVRGARPSLAQDHAARKRGEVDAINGAIPEEAAKVGLAAPVNLTVANLIRARESTF